MDCRLFTNSLLEKEFGSRVVLVLHVWLNHFHISHTYFMDCRIFTNSLLEKEFVSRVVWALHGW